jgi:hypothetical protein
MPVADDTRYCLYLLPWLSAQGAVRFGSVIVAPLDEAVAADDSRLETVYRIFGIYKGLGATQLRPTIMWPSTSDPLRLSDDDVALVVAHRDWLSAAAIMGDQYFSPLDAPFTDANADGFGQRFTVGTEHLALTKRRRDGQSIDGWPIAKLSTQMPLSASPTYQFSPDQALLDAFAALASRDDDFAGRLLEAIPLFNQANRLSERTALSYDLVFLGGALERLYDVSGPGIAEKLADAVSTLFDRYHHGFTTWQNRAATSGKVRDDEGSWTKRWVREFYAHRSAIHGGSPHTSSWSDLWHGLLATEAFSLSVKVLLGDIGVRPMSDDDVLAAECFDERIQALTTTAPSTGWWDAHRAASRRVMIAAMAEELRSQS